MQDRLWAVFSFHVVRILRTLPPRNSPVSLNVTSAVPEPSTWAMMILGFAGVGFMAYRRRKGAMIAA